ncbi:L-aminoadipate-semialdehyde dehydrogenase Ecym_3457 [Eremothecium cymbalariae DBVPG|uniref:Alpha-aminoadipate reductase n=1 Tax=Eremothecium cymbalariae (strain CBS 270.75 / DBVPG 7215 / KCTC 17166 / NRRL Y-17582) TaxID=931890 RepID=G8JS22_ERECY|nr:Hypothetical protein Ecym_3457 [Eremothecium cymbalariae DBVPG\
MINKPCEMTQAQQIWSSKLENPTISDLPRDYLRPQRYPFVKQDRIIIELPLLELLTDKDAYVSVLSIWATLIYRWTGDDDIVLYIKDDRILRFRILPMVTFDGLYDQLLKELDGTLKMPAVSVDALTTYMKESKGLDINPQLFRIGCVSQQKDLSLLRFKYQTFDCILNLKDSSKVELVFNALLYSSDRMAMLADQFTAFISQVVGDNSNALTISTVPLITDSALKVLPDPTTNLGWCDFRGCIHDIFQANAKKFPDRTCVVETPSFGQTSGRIFSYRDIDNISNIVAHYLMHTGIKRGDVVMIYSSRGVDLVVSVLGVLKAGATFSVIDPAYPPARQTVYLGVAKPAGLIVIQSAGQLDDFVEEYISKELNLASRIPSIAAKPGGTVRGGTLPGSMEDCLASFECLKDTCTSVVVGPDDNPTLSFTSGSEGIPKGVLGRHFSLAYYFDWMSEKFNLSENDKFTMLSGIAHDPIQRDMFTPLFLGAQLLIPTADDIGTPGELAKWMATYEATVTHLTPAMGQLLTAQATTTFPSLHHAFFVGDILTKRDCLRIQTLGENVTIVNMYGTTETQRAVSFFEVKSRASDPEFLRRMKDVIPAGRGMFNVQLLVVNRFDSTKLCAPGEVGEIYVRAGGLSEGYRGLPELTAQKFLTNWFVSEDHWNNINQKGEEPWKKLWMGPRDRLYRTGDLGRYLPDGNCECCGRADDQVKIRGFRIELGEIDTNISQHPLVRENVTVVRKNSENEPTLITFIVPRFDKPELKSFVAEVPNTVPKDDVVSRLIKYHRLTKDIKDSLKKRLANYAIPTIIITMNNLPLNPNGKVDKPKLQYPTPKQLNLVLQHSSSLESNEDSFSALEKDVLGVWLDVLPSQPTGISPDDSFFDLGGHSILVTRLIFELRKKFGVSMPLSSIFKFPTLKSFATELRRIKESKPSQGDEALDVEYSKDAVQLSDTALMDSYPSHEPLSLPSETHPCQLTVFLTGATGFLGSYILADLLNRSHPLCSVKVYAHVRAKNEYAGMARLKEAGIVYGTWDDSFADHISVIVGDLSKPQFTLDDSAWKKLVSEIDIIIHNGAFVHWVYQYSQIRDANVISTINVINMAASGKPKFFTFVSSTSVLDTEHYQSLSEKLISEGNTGIAESDELGGSSSGLTTGYGQSKWVAEYLIRQAGKRGLRGCIVRPGYVTGSSISGSCNTDDFLLRFLRGVVQIGKMPDLTDTVNMVPVEHVARIVTAVSFNPPQENELCVAHVTGRPRISFKDYLNALTVYGYDVEIEPYESWKQSLEASIKDEGEQNALYPLLHLVLDNLPANIKAPELDDRNTVLSLKKDIQWSGVDVSSGAAVSQDTVGIYISFLNRVGYLPPPTQGSSKLPPVTLNPEQVRMVSSGMGGRASAAKVIL